MTQSLRSEIQCSRLGAVLLTTGIILAVTVGFRQVAGLYTVPVSQALRGGVEPFSRAMAIVSLVWGVTSIFAGGIADRFGSVPVLVAGLLFMMLGYFLMHSAGTTSMLMWSGIFIGLGIGTCGQTVMVGMVGRIATPAQRSNAFAKLAMANGIGQFIALPYVHLSMELFGWRGSLLVIIATLACLLPLTLLIREEAATPTMQRSQSLREALLEATSLPSYWLLTAGFFVCGFHVGFYAVHLPAYAASLGFESWVGVSALTLVGVANIAGTYFAGRSTKYLRQQRTLSLIYLTRSLVFLGLLLLPPSPATILTLSAILGLFWLATMPLTSGLVATFFGTTWLSLLYGIVAFAHQLGGFVGVWAAGVLFDITKSYDAMWWISFALGIIAALLHWPIRERGVPRLRQGLT
jgi:predicted MFS family arabinose efflux permease